MKTGEFIQFSYFEYSYDIVIDKSVAQDIIKAGKKRGIMDYDDVLNCRFKLITTGNDTSIGRENAIYFNISGIANNNSKSVWMKEELIYSITTPVLVDYRVLGDDFSITSGSIPTSESYIMLNDQYKTIKEGGAVNSIGAATGQYFVSGVYRLEDENTVYNLSKIFVTQLEFIKIKYFKYTYYRNQDFDMLVYATDVEACATALIDAGYEISVDIYEPTLAQTIKLEENQTFYLLAIGGILMSAFCIYLVMRSSLISRMYEVSVYRSIGISRREVKRMFLAEILLTTTFSSILGFLLMLLLLTSAGSGLDLASLTRFTGLSVLLVFVGIYGINILFGLIPINGLLRKTPSNIMKQSDI